MRPRAGWNEQVFAGEEIDLALGLKKQGRFVIVREPVVTSGRKVRTHSAGEILGMMARGLLRPSIRKSREGLEIWYGAAAGGSVCGGDG